MRIEIIAIGSELTAGITVDTNSSMIARKLRQYGLEVSRVSLVSDEPERLEEIFREVFSRADVTVVTGGLGPTEDDRTRFVVAEIFDAPLEEDAESLERLKNIFAVFAREMPESNCWQAMFPKGAQILENPVGTARGFAVEKENRLAIFAPGVPRELEKMADYNILPLIVERSGKKVSIATVTLYTFGMPESELADSLKEYVASFPDVELAYSAKFPTIDLRLTARAGGETEAAEKISSARKYIEGILGNRIFGEDKDTIASVVGKLLVEQNRTLALAESCTGGMVSSALVDVPGSSDFLIEAAVTYSNDAKIRRLGVLEKILEEHGAVSVETALEMAKGIRKTAKADIGFAITGVAGPSGGTSDKPVGTVCMALAHSGGTMHWINRLPGGRMRIRKLATFAAMNRVRRFCLGLSQEEDAQYNCTD